MRVINPITAGNWKRLLRYAETCDPAELISILKSWNIGVVDAELLSNGAIRLHFWKPLTDRMETTRRDLETCQVFAILIHCVAGGGVAIQPQGPKGEHYNPRVTVHGKQADGKKRRFAVSRLSVMTPLDRLTRENRSDFRILANGLSYGPSGSDRYLLGFEDAIRFTLDRVTDVLAKRPDRLPPGLTVERVRALLETAYEMIRSIRPQPLPDTAE